jgi:hypothetical protein
VHLTRGKDNHYCTEIKSRLKMSRSISEVRFQDIEEFFEYAFPARGGYLGPLTDRRELFFTISDSPGTQGRLVLLTGVTKNFLLGAV